MQTPADFKQLAKKATDSRMKMRYLALYHFQRGYSRTQVAEMLGVARGSVNTWVAKYLSGGLDALQVKPNPGRPARLSSQQLEQLSLFVKDHAIKPDGGRLIAEDVRSYIQTMFGIEYQQGNVYRLLHTLGYSWITSRSKHPKQSKEAQEAFKKLRPGNDPSRSRPPSS